ncbi:RNA methyltransferase [Salmonella enterica subsp. enterica]|uniref:RNA methyltransferase n=1 Tax=Salmonella enterica I TaxID=59201 RepID=A0A447U6B2_SALET|nr:RNA methyltransferase [Salmonella enterica subsp. enterica]
MQCALYHAGRCRSCQWITQSVNEQLSAKTADLHRLLAGLPVEQWCGADWRPGTAFPQQSENGRER